LARSAFTEIARGIINTSPNPLVQTKRFFNYAEIVLVKFLVGCSLINSLNSSKSNSSIINMGFEGNTPPSSDKPDIIPDRFIVTLKPFLTSSEVDTHCARIRDLCSPVGITSTDDGAAPLSTFLTFGLGGSEGVSTASAEDSNPQDTLRGYSGFFTGEVLETVQKSNEVTQSSSKTQASHVYTHFLEGCRHRA
jgi:hypothetical protein